MTMKKSIGYEIKNLDIMIVRRIFAEAKIHNDEFLTPVQIRIIDYLYNNIKLDIYQKDIEKKFTLRRSTISGILQTMEKNGLIEKIDSKQDARSKKVIITEKGLNKIKEIKNKMIKFEKILRQDITDEELELFFNIVNKLKRNISNK